MSLGFLEPSVPSCRRVRDEASPGRVATYLRKELRAFRSERW